MQRLVHITQKVDQELQSLTRSRVVRVLVNPILQQPSNVFNPIKNIDFLRSCPTARSRVSTVVWGIVIDGSDIVQSCRPPHAKFDFIGPGGDRSQVAVSFVKDITQGWKNGWMQIHLSYRSYYFMAYK